MSRLVGSGTGLTVKVTFDHKTKAGERTECELVEGRVLQSEGRVAVEAGVPGTPRGLRQLRQREQGGEGVGGSDGGSCVPDQSCPRGRLEVLGEFFSKGTI